MILWILACTGTIDPGPGERVDTDEPQPTAGAQEPRPYEGSCPNRSTYSAANRNLRDSRRKRWVTVAGIVAFAFFVYDTPASNYSGFLFFLMGILVNFGLLGLGGANSNFCPCPQGPLAVTLEIQTARFVRWTRSVRCR